MFSVITLIPMAIFTVKLLPQPDQTRCDATVLKYQRYIRTKVDRPKGFRPLLDCSAQDSEYREERIQAIHEYYGKHGLDFTVIEQRYKNNMERLTFTRIKIVSIGLGFWLVSIGIVYLFGWTIGWVIKGFKSRGET